MARPRSNTRVALLAMIEAAERNGWEFETADEDDVVETMFAAAAGEIVEVDFIAWVSRRMRPPAS